MTARRRSPARAARRLIDRPARTPQQEARSQVYWGAAAVVFVVTLLLVAAGLYVFTPGQQRVRADFAEAGLIKVGDGVRVAGIPVGNVKKISLATDHTVVEMAITSSVHVGDESSAEVRLLTIVGGNYIELSPAGRDELGGSSIPVTRTTLPYNLIQTFAQAAPKLSRIDANPLRETLVQLRKGLGDNPGAVRGDLTVLSSMLTNLNARQDDFGALLRLASEYTAQLDANGDVITDLVHNLSSFLTEYSTFYERFNRAFNSLTLLLERVRGIASVYQSDIDPLVRQLDEIGRGFGPALRRYTPLISQGRDLITRLEKMVGPDGTVDVGGGAAPLVLSSDLCIPMAGVNC